MMQNIMVWKKTGDRNQKKKSCHSVVVANRETKSRRFFYVVIALFQIERERERD